MCRDGQARRSRSDDDRCSARSPRRSSVGRSGPTHATPPFATCTSVARERPQRPESSSRPIRRAGRTVGVVAARTVLRMHRWPESWQPSLPARDSGREAVPCHKERLPPSRRSQRRLTQRAHAAMAATNSLRTQTGFRQITDTHPSVGNRQAPAGSGRNPGGGAQRVCQAGFALVIAGATVSTARRCDRDELACKVATL